MEALQLDFQEVQLLQLPSVGLPGSAQGAAAAAAAANSQQQQVWQQPGIRLLGVPGVQLFQQLQRKPGCVPSSLRLQEVWFSTGPEYGQWRMHIRGSFYHQATAAAAAGAAAGAANAAERGLLSAVAPAAANGQVRQQQQQQQGPPDVYEYDLRSGHCVRTAVLQLLRLLHMQLFLNRLEGMAWGAQSLQVVRVGSSSSSSMWPSPAAVQLQHGVLQSGSMPAAAAGGSVDAAADEDDGAQPPAERAKQKQQQQQDGLNNGSAAAAEAGAGMANGVLSHSAEAAGNGQLPISNGELADGPLQHHKPKAAAGVTSSSSANGLLFHWENTGLVRLAQYSCETAVLECGAPLQPVAAGSSSSSSGRQRLQFAVQWQPRFEYTTHSSYSNSTGSSSTTSEWVDVRPHTPAGTAAAGSSSSGTHDKAVSAAEVLAMTCSMQCNAPHVPADVLNELCDMANSSSEDLMLDALSIVAWPLAGIAAALAAPAAAPLAGNVSCRAVSSCALSGPYHVRYRVDWLLQQPQQQSASAAVSSAAATAASVLMLEMVFACHGSVRVLIRQQDSAPAPAPQQQQQQSPPGSSQAAVAAAIRGFVQQFVRQRGAQVPLLPAVSNGCYQTRLPEKGSRSADVLAGFWLQTQHLSTVLQDLLQYWQQHVVGKQQQQGAAAAVKVEALPAPQQQQQSQQPQVQQQQQSAAPIQQQPGQAAVAGPAAGAMQQQQQQLGQVPLKSEQQQQQQQPVMQNSHMLQQPMQHAAAGHVVSGR
jgi:hypothetical protein